MIRPLQLSIELKHQNGKKEIASIQVPDATQAFFGRIFDALDKRQNDQIQSAVLDLRSAFQGIPEVSAVLAMLAYSRFNFWSSGHFLATCGSILPVIDTMRGNVAIRLEEQLDALAWRPDFARPLADLTAEAYLHARERFGKGELVAADNCLQVGHAFRYAFYTPLTPVDMLSMASALNLQTNTVLAFDKRAPYVDSYDTADQPNRKGFAQLVAEHVPTTGSCLDLGCYDGAAMRAVGSEMRRRGGSPRLTGIEPVTAAVNHVRQRYPELAVIEGDSIELSSGKFDAELPPTIDCLCASAVCQLLDPDELDRLLAWAGSRVGSIALCDDVVNADGDHLAARSYYYLHPYRQVLARYGFEIIHLSMVPEPDRPYSGYILARNTRQI